MASSSIPESGTLPDLPLEVGEGTVDLEAVAEEKGIQFFLVSYSPLNTDSRTSLVPRSAIGHVQRHGCGVPGAMYFDSHGAEPELYILPDPNTLIQLPWKPEIAWLSSNVYMDGKPYSQCPRGALIRQMTRARRMGYVMKAGVEPEFTLLDGKGVGFADSRDARQPMSLQEPLATMRQLPFLTRVHQVMDQLGWGPYELDHEASCCQYEVNYGYTDAVTCADRQAFMKFMIKELAELEGMTATFMPVPLPNLLCANGLHVNVSLWSYPDDVSAFEDSKDAELGISEVTRHFIGGLLRHAKSSCAIMCPTINSYKRLNAGSWCPNTITWGGNNRTVLLRVPASNRVEHRLADGLSNPYLTQAAILAAGLDGIENSIDPGRQRDDIVSADDPDVDKMPISLLDSLRLLQESQSMKDSLGQDLINAFVKLKMREWNSYSSNLSQWEKDYYVGM